ncbi:TPA: hypothetical protein MYI72_004650 [Klebsiella pneumoniae]|nr:hypothetical protein [Klebsiella pneumoniae]
MNIETVNELIQSLESAGEPSIKEGKYLKVAKLCVQLAAENVALKAACGGDGSYSNCPACTFSEYIEAPETPATDRIVAEAEARGVEKFAAKLRIPGDDQFFDALAKGVALAADDFAKQLREGADK